MIIIRILQIAALIGAVHLASGCTVVNADLEHNTVSVYTLLTSRQDVVVGCDAAGNCLWTAKQSDANSALAESLLNITRVAAKAAAVP